MKIGSWDPGSWQWVFWSNLLTLGPDVTEKVRLPLLAQFQTWGSGFQKNQIEDFQPSPEFLCASASILPPPYPTLPDKIEKLV